LLIDIVNNLKVEDTSHSTQIIENISLIFAQLNQQRIALSNKRKSIGEKEAKADFQAQMTLFEQSIVNYLELATSPEKCDDFLTKLSIQLEELEGRFVDYDDFIELIGEKRESIYAAFEAKKNNLTESRNKRAGSLFASAERMLKGIKSRAASFSNETEINGYFASDLMIEKVRSVAEQLEKIGDSAKSEDLANQVQVLKQETLRALKDKKELFEEGNNIIKLGAHRFAVNSQKLDLTLIIKDKKYFYHLTGTSYYEPIDATTLYDLKDVWEQELPSENREVKRAEYLAWQLFKSLNSTQKLTDLSLKEKINEYTAANYGEGYVKGVHDHDALLILKNLLQKHSDLGLLRFSPDTRILAQLFWHFTSEEKKAYFKKQFVLVNLLKQAFPDTKEHAHLIEKLTEAIQYFATEHQFFEHTNVKEAAIYLSEEQVTDGFVIDKVAFDILKAFQKELKSKNADLGFQNAQQELKAHIAEYWHLCRQWVITFLDSTGKSVPESTIDEVAGFIMTDASDAKYVQSVSAQEKIEGLKSITHSSEEGKESYYLLDYHEFCARLNHFVSYIKPRYLQLQELKHQLIEVKRRSLRLHEFQTQVLTSFVRNKLINQVYFPLIGSNFAKQIGAYGNDKRTDRSGMLLLISPPGYGKTTLMEYVADRLGLIFMKINGPSIGHEITSVDPGEAKNAATKQELQKLNLAFEMSDNVMLYLDDIQHCNPEFLQKFISLADGQRKIEGVFNGEAKTYDFRGKRFCVVMAGNPYTESGDKFQIPDMLSNRADIYNLGDTASNKADLFRLSLIENGLTSNDYLKSITQYGMENLYKLVSYIDNNEQSLPVLEGNLSPQEIQDCIKVLQKIMHVRDVVLKVNGEYIRSAAMSDDYRTEPPFKLQGSYRDMNKLMSQVVPIMKEKEVLQLLLDHYQNESQTLTSDAEANLLKLAELMDNLDEEKARRWSTIKETFTKNNKIKGLGDSDRMSQIIGQMTLFVEGLENIEKALSKRKN
ncbi:AAA family ATPase, partial [Marivirga lumbricoides]